MAGPSLKQRIELIGDKDVQAAFKRIGESGERAFENVKQAAKDVTTAGRGINGFIAGVRREFERLRKEGERLRRGLSQIGRGIGQVTTRFSILTAAGAAAAGAIALQVKAATELADEHIKASQAIGITIKEYGRLRFVLDQGGVDAGKFATAFTRLNRVISEAARGIDNDGTRALQELGIAVKDANGNVIGAEEVFKAIAARFVNFEDGALKTALAVRLFGRAGAILIPTLNQGADAIQKLGDMAERFQQVFTEDQGKVAEALNDSIARIFLLVGGIRNQIALLFAPVFLDISEAIQNFILQNLEAIYAFGKNFRDALVPIFQDMALLIQGLEPQTSIVQSLVSVFTALGSAAQLTFSIIRGGFEALVAVLEPVVFIINKLFGTELEARTLVITALVFNLLGVFTILGGVISTVAGAIALFGAGPVIAAVTGVVLAFLFLKTAVNTVIAGIELLGEILSGLNTEALQANIAGALNGLSVLGAKIAAFFTSLPGVLVEVVKQSIQGLGQLFLDFGAFIIKTMEEAAQAIGDAFKGLFDFVGGIFSDIASGIGGLVSSIKGAIEDIFGGGSEANGPGGFARGGHVRGPGNGQSDSILARLSNGEYVQRAAAVRKYGVEFMASINNLQFPIGALRGFADGGLVSLQPALAAALPNQGGGSSANMRPLTLTIGADTFQGLLAPETVADKLVNYAAKSQLRSAGRKPNWYGG